MATVRKPVKGKPGLYQVGKGYAFKTRVDGKQVWVRCSEHGIEYTTASDADRFRKRYLGTDDAHKIVPSAMTFKDLADELMDTSAGRWRETSRRQIQLRIDTHLAGLFSLKVRDITWQDVHRLVVSPMMDKGLSGNTIHNALMAATNVFEYGIDRQPRVVAENPVKRLRAGKHRPGRKVMKPRRVLTPAELGAILDNAPTNGDRVAFALMALAGLRLGEALGLRWEDIDWTAGKINVAVQLDKLTRTGDAPTKTESSVGSVELAETLRKILRGWQLKTGARTGLILVTKRGRPMDHRAVQAALKASCKDAQVAEPLPTPHDFRHTFASALLTFAASNGDIHRVSRQLRHRNPQITLTTYAHEWAALTEGTSGGQIDQVFGAAVEAAGGRS